MYSKYNNALLQESGIDFNQYIRSLRKAGNESGIYSDVALLLYRLVASSHTKSVIEFGSGMSTYILAKAAADHTKQFVAMEHLQEWYDVTANCMSSLGIPTKGYTCTLSDWDRFAKVDEPIDVAWVDGPIAHRGPHDETYGRLESCDHYWAQLKDAVLLHDDAQTLPLIEPWLRKVGRGPELDFWFNPTGRADRQVYISFPTTDHPLRAVVESCIF